MFGLGRKFACYSGLAIVTFVFATSCDPSGSSGDRQEAVRINEVMARNRSTVVVDDLGRLIVQDWVELYNPTGRTASLNGLTLSDDPDEPDKYRFPAGRTLAPGEFLIVYVFDPEDCEPRCRQELDECRAALIDPAQPEEVAECDLEFEECLASCEVSGLIADFGLGANDTIYLFERDGERLSDRVGVTEPEQDISVGRFPDGTGGYGVIYAGPTPGEPNMPTDLGPLSIESGIEFDTIIPDCSENVEARFHVTLDEDRKDSLQVRFEYADVVNCSGPETPEEASFTDEGVLLSIESEEQLPPEDRIDIENETVSVARTRITYRALLPGAACGTARTTRVVASVEGLEQRRVGDCSTWGEEQQLPTLAFNEYVPRNSVLEFNFIRGEDVGTPGSIPVSAGNRLDWIEIVNYGDQPIDISDFALVGLREWNRFLRGEEEALEPWLFLDESKDYEFRPIRFVIQPGCFLLLVTDGDDGGFRRSYRMVDESLLRGDVECQLQDLDGRSYFYSTDFRLEATPDEGEAPDGVVLLDPNGRRLDLLEIAFDEISEEFLDPGRSPPTVKQNVAMGRPTIAEATYTAPLIPGEFLCVPTPGGDNATACDIPPKFDDALSIFPRNPLEFAPVELLGQVSFDLNTPIESITFEVHYTIDADGVDRVLTIGDGVTFVEADDQSSAAAAGRLFDFRADFPGLADGSHVEFFVLARDEVLAQDPSMENDAEVILEDRPESNLSFEYLVQFEPSVDAVRISELVPANRTIQLPPFADSDEQEHHDYVEFFNPGSDVLDLSGYYLAQENTPESTSSRIQRAREWEFPDGSTIEPGGVLTVYFGPPPDPAPADYIENDAFDIACVEVLYLIAPDGAENGANSIVDSISWDLNVPNFETLCRIDIALGRLCAPQYIEIPPSPDAPNQRPTLFHSAYHAELFGGTNLCVDRPFVRFTAIAFLDSTVAVVSDPVNGDPRFAIDSSEFVVTIDGEDQVFPVLASDFSCDGGSDPCEPAPPGYSTVIFETTIPVPSSAGPVVEYRFQLEDVCGDFVESPTLSFGTADAEPALLAINEINRSSALPGVSEDPIAWIEIVNPSAIEVDVGGMFLTTNEQLPQMSQLPEGLAIAAGEFVAIPLEELVGELELGDTRTLRLIDSVVRGSCLVNTFDFDFSGLDLGQSVGRNPEGDVVVLETPSPGASNFSSTLFVRADVTEDGLVTFSDMIRLTQLILHGDTRMPQCEDAMDADDNGVIDINDAILIGNYAYGDGGVVIVAPHPVPGVDPTPDELLPCGGLAR